MPKNKLTSSRRLARGSAVVLTLALAAGLCVKSGILSANPAAPAAGASAGAAPLPPPPGAAGTTPAKPADGATEGADGEGGAPGAPPGPPQPKSATIRLVIKTVPSSRRAFVYWGKKKLGVTEKKAPLIIQRPRDSGPLDLLVRADDCVPVYTRAYTFDDNTLSVKVTPNDQKQTIYGYKAELPPEDVTSEGDVAPGAAPLPSGGTGAGGGRNGSLFTR